MRETHESIGCPHVFTQKPTGETEVLLVVDFRALGKYQYARTITVIFLPVISLFSNASACNRKVGAVSPQTKNRVIREIRPKKEKSVILNNDNKESVTP